MAPVHRFSAPLARRLLQICTTVTAEAIAGTGLTPLQFGALSYLKDEPDIDQGGLAGRLGIDPSNASLLIGQLESERLVQRLVNSANRRARLLRLTPRGTKLVERLRPGVRAANDRVLVPLTAKERELLLNMLVRVVEGSKTHARPGTGRRKRARRIAPAEPGGRPS
jgi:DNA-binding MarR family transcriptional regulator